VTTANREGPLVTVGNVRSAIKARMQADWLSYYMAEAERAEGITEGDIQRPKSWQMPSERSKWPESKLPAVLIVVAGTTGAERLRGDGDDAGLVRCELGAICKGISDDDAWRQASVYGAALRQFGAKQLDSLADLDVEGVSWDDNGESYDDVPQERAARCGWLRWRSRCGSTASSRRIRASPSRPIPRSGTLAPILPSRTWTIIVDKQA
jgi:hypothetical protein